MTPEELKEAIAYNLKETQEGDFGYPQIVRLVQFWQEHHELEQDGWAGPFTQGSLDADMGRSRFGKPPITVVGPEVIELFEPWDGPQEKQPKSYKEAVKYFGNPETSRGSDKLDKAWYKANIRECHGSTRLPGVPAKWYVKVHRMVEPYLREALARASRMAPDYKISRLGGFNFRHIRHDPRRPLSMHAFGCAVDIDPGRNRAIMFAKGESPRAWSPEYYKYWPKGMPENFVKAMASCGFACGHDWNEDGSTHDHRWLDKMHYEWIARDGNQFDV